MRLILENGKIQTNPTTSQIEEALKSIENGENNFLVLERDNDHFLQAALHEVSGFYIEYHNRKEKKHFKSVNQFNSFEITVNTLVDYAKRNIRWYNVHRWEVLSEFLQPRNNLFSPSSIIMIFGLLIIIGITFFDDIIKSTFNIYLNGYHFYILTFAIGLTLPRFWVDFKDWSNLELLSKTYVISAFLTFFIMILLSICTYFRHGNMLTKMLYNTHFVRTGKQLLLIFLHARPAAQMQGR